MKYNGNQISFAVRPDAKLGKKTVSTIGKYFAFNDGLDGYNVLEVMPQQLTPTEKDFLCGNSNKITQVLDETVTDVVTDVSGCFPNLSAVVVANTTQVVTGLDTMIGDLQGVTFIVPNSLESEYQAAYPDLTFDSWVLDLVTTIPYIGNSTLTCEYVALFAQTAGGSVELVTKVIVPPDFTSFETGVFDYIFLKFPNCEEIEYGTPRVPTGYQEVEYIEGTGTQYVDTGFQATDYTDFEVKWITNQNTNTSLLGTSGLGLRGASNTSGSFRYARAGVETGYFSGNSPDIRIFKTENGKVYIDGVFAIENNSTGGTNYSTFKVFTQGTAGSGKYTLYYLKLYDNGTLVRDFVPCYRKSDNAIGLYDLVGNQFYANAGTGTFSKGEDALSGFISRPALSTCHIYHDENTSHTLTAQIVQDTLTRFPEYANCEKVVVDEWFTEYESGSINAIISAFTSMEVLTTTYENGVIDINFSNETWQEIISAIESEGDTLDSALVETRSVAHAGTTYPSVHIVPPLLYPSNPTGYFNNQKVKYIGKITTNNTDGVNSFISICNSLRMVDGFEPTSSNGWSVGYSFGNMQNVKEFRGFDMSKCILVNNDNYLFGRNPKMQFVEANGLKLSFNISQSTLMTREALLHLINSLGTPLTTQTLTIGATNLAKLTAEDIAIATAKNWQVQ